MSSLSVCMGPPSPRDGVARDDVVTMMLAAAPHRGAPGRSATLGRCTMGVSRHIDEHNQASIKQQNGLLVGFEGRLDNARDLSVGLGLGAAATDDQILTEAFRAVGIQLAKRMRGRYCVAISDGEQLWAWRDHLGFASAFYRTDTATTYFATEAKQVAAGAGIGIAPDLGVVDRILWGEYDDETPAAVKGVRRLPKASIFAVRAGASTIGRYWNPESMLETRSAATVADLQDEFDVLMSQACSRVLTGADVVSLSGGMDSPAVAAYSAPAYRRLTDGGRLPAVSTVYPDHPGVDESKWVTLVARELDLDLETIPHHAQGLGDLDSWTRRFDGPVPALWVEDLATQYLCCARRGFKTMLTGEIAEFVVDMRGSLVPHLLRAGRLGPAFRDLARQRQRGVRVSRLARQAGSTLVPRGVAALAQRRGWVGGGDAVPWVSQPRLRAARSKETVSPAQSWAAWQLGAFDGPGLSIEADDVVQAVTGVTSRRPWADVDLWEWFLRLPAESKFPDERRKGVARALLRGRVPDAILDRRDKTYFNDALLGSADYAELRRWLIRPAYRFAGIDYRLLADELDRGTLDLPSYIWAKNLASAHAFVEAA